MIRLESAAALLLLAALSACDGTDPDEEELHALLSGANEVPARTTTATGTADFVVEEDGTVEYDLEVANLRNVSAAHIHGPADAATNTGVLVTLFSSSPPSPGPVTGDLTDGTFDQADLNASGQPVASMDSILKWMREGRAYVNVHTNDGVAPTNTGPGDFPGGEIRGQVTRGRR